MKTKTIFLLFFLSNLLLLTTVQAQSAIENISVEMELIPENDPYAELGPDSFPLPRHAPTILVEVNNTEDITAIQSAIGTTAGATDLAEKTFDFQTQGILEDGTIYSVNGSTARLYFGSFHHQGTYYIKVRLQLPDGSFSDWQEVTAQ